MDDSYGWRDVIAACGDMLALVTMALVCLVAAVLIPGAAGHLLYIGGVVLLVQLTRKTMKPL